jgi:DNA-directed RNA polymerase specialized sigma subunit
LITPASARGLDRLAPCRGDQSGLSARERNFLRLYFVQGLTVDQIGQMQGTHKSTVSC